jgi:hypothetical protein
VKERKCEETHTLVCVCVCVGGGVDEKGSKQMQKLNGLLKK